MGGLVVSEVDRTWGFAIADGADVLVAELPAEQS